jgi:trigger factor
MDLEAKNDIVKYVVTADDKLIDGQVARIQNNLELQFQEVVAADSDVTGTFINEEKVNNATTIAADLLKIKQLLIYSLVKK